MLLARDLRVHLKEQPLPIEEFKVLHLQIPHHLLDVVVLTCKVHFSVAQAANRPLRIRIYSQYWQLSVLDHAGCLEEGSIAAERKDQIDFGVLQVLILQLIVLLDADLSARSPESFNYFVGHCDVHICCFRPI